MKCVFGYDALGKLNDRPVQVLIVRVAIAQEYAGVNCSSSLRGSAIPVEICSSVFSSVINAPSCHSAVMGMPIMSASLMNRSPINDETADKLSSSDSFLNPLKSSDLIAAADLTSIPMSRGREEGLDRLLSDSFPVRANRSSQVACRPLRLWNYLMITNDSRAHQAKRDFPQDLCQLDEARSW